MYVVVWETKCGRGGHQMALEKSKAEYLGRQLSRLRPTDNIMILPAHDYAAAAVVERQRRTARDARTRKGPPKFPHQRALT
jgi:hypothetical protein